MIVLPDDMKDPETIFFLGAGASVEAGVPDTYEMASQFIKEIQENDKEKVQAESSEMTVFNPFRRIVKILEHWNKSRNKDRIDVEQLLETLEKLENRNEEVLLRFAGKGDDILAKAKIGYLIAQLKRFIKRATIVEEQQIMYLSPLLDFIEPSPLQSLVIFSVNYDSCIEMLCSVYKKRYTDGFNIFWSPEEFTNPYDIKLYKIHGSVMWYRTTRNEYVKIPVKTEESRIQLITNEYAEPLILYPMGKFEYIEPLTEMQIELRKRLENKNTKHVIIVGYSFRDNYVVQILWDAARKNREFIIILVNPKAKYLYEEKLRYYNRDLKIPSSLEGRVICLPYEFGKLLSLLKNVYLKSLREAWVNEKNVLEVVRRGERQDWRHCFEKYSECEYASKVNGMLDDRRVEWNSLSWEDKTKCSFNMLMHSLSTKDGKFMFWVDKLNESLEDFSVENLTLVADGRLRVRYQKGNDVHAIEEKVNWVLSHYEAREDFLPAYTIEIVTPLLTRLNLFLERCKSLENKKVADYAEEMSKDYPSEMEELRSLDVTSGMERRKEIITHIERKE